MLNKQAKKITKQFVLREVYDLGEDIRHLLDMLNKKRKRLRHLNYKLIYELENNWPLQKGEFTVELEEVLKCKVNWKNLLKKHLGDKWFRDIEVANQTIEKKVKVNKCLK